VGVYASEKEKEEKNEVRTKRRMSSVGGKRCE
jgi:hypothetical protein